MSIRQILLSAIVIVWICALVAPAQDLLQAKQSTLIRNVEPSSLTVKNNADPATLLLLLNAPVIERETGSIITAIVRDRNGQPLPNTLVQFTTSHGQLSAVQATTNADGTASVAIEGNGDAGNGIVTAQVNNLIERTYIQVGTIGGASASRMLTVNVANSSLTSGEQTQITVLLKDDQSNPITGQPVTIKGTLGALSSTNGVTDNQGTFVTAFHTGSQAGRANVVALAGYSSSSVTIEILPSNQPPTATAAPNKTPVNTSIPPTPEPKNSPLPPTPIVSPVDTGSPTPVLTPTPTRENGNPTDKPDNNRSFLPMISSG